jgi:hypothetical protein
MERIDRAEQSVRWRAFGLVFGYPEYAVEFFVDAGKSEKKTGKFVERGFLAIPTVASDTGRFVYAVPKGHVERDEDRQLKMAAAPIFEQYLARRALFIRDGGVGAVALLQDWTSSISLCHSVQIPRTCVPRAGRRSHFAFRRHP